MKTSYRYKIKGIKISNEQFWNLLTLYPKDISSSTAIMGLKDTMGAMVILK